jgi:hypothetical protein
MTREQIAEAQNSARMENRDSRKSHVELRAGQLCVMAAYN